MHAAHIRRMVHGKLDDLTQRLVIHAFGKRWHQHHWQARALTVFYRPKLDILERTSAQHAIYLVIQTVKLQKHRRYACFRQIIGVPLFLCQAHAVGVELEKSKSLHLAQSDDLCQIVAHRWLAAGKLDIIRTAMAHEMVVLLRDFIQRQISRFRIASAGKAHRAGQVAAICQLQKRAANRLLVVRAKATIIWTALLCVPGKGQLRRRMTIARRPFSVAFCITFPDQCAPAAMFRAGFFHIDLSVLTHHFFCRDRTQAHRTDAGCFSNHV